MVQRGETLKIGMQHIGNKNVLLVTRTTQKYQQNLVNSCCSGSEMILTCPEHKLENDSLESTMSRGVELSMQQLGFEGIALCTELYTTTDSMRTMATYGPVSSSKIKRGCPHFRILKDKMIVNYMHAKQIYMGKYSIHTLIICCLHHTFMLGAFYLVASFFTHQELQYQMIMVIRVQSMLECAQSSPQMTCHIEFNHDNNIASCFLFWSCEEYAMN